MGEWEEKYGNGWFRFKIVIAWNLEGLWDFR